MRILSIVRYDFIKLLRNKTALLLMLVLPTLITLIIGLAYGSMGDGTEGSKIPVGVVNNDNSDIAKELISGFKNNGTVIVMEMEEDKLAEKVRNAGVEVGFIIPDGFGAKILAGQKPVVQVLKLPSSVDYRAIEEIMNGVFGELQMTDIALQYMMDKFGSATGSEKEMMKSNKEMIKSNFQKIIESALSEVPVISVKEVMVSGKETSTDYNGVNSGAIGIAVMYVMFSAVFGIGDILEEKKNYTWNRIDTTPALKSTVMAGKVIGIFLQGWAQIAILMLFGKFIMGVDWGNSFFSTFLLFSIYLLCVTGLGMFLATLVKTNAQLGAYASIIIVSTSMLSGCYWPIELVPEFMQRIAKFFPQYWAVKGLGNTVNANMGLQSVITPLLVLILMGIMYFTLAIVSERFKAGIKSYKLRPKGNSL